MAVLDEGGGGAIPRKEKSVVFFIYTVFVIVSYCLLIVTIMTVSEECKL
jgi:hypothetical protein